jgi:hypothetical protein
MSAAIVVSQTYLGLHVCRRGLVASLARPGGNLTGITFLAVDLSAKRLELLRELVPGTARVAVLVNPAEAAVAETTLRDVETAARGFGSSAPSRPRERACVSRAADDPPESAPPAECTRKGTLILEPSAHLTLPQNHCGKSESPPLRPGELFQQTARSMRLPFSSIRPRPPTNFLSQTPFRSIRQNDTPRRPISCSKLDASDQWPSQRHTGFGFLKSPASFFYC